MDSDQVKLIRDQVRLVVDPMFMRLRHEIYGPNTTFGKYFNEDKMPPGIAEDVASEVIDNLNEGGELVRTWNYFPVDSIGVQTGKAVVFNATTGKASHADCHTSSHAGRIVGVAMEPGSPNQYVKVQTYGIMMNSGVFSFSAYGPALVGLNGAIVSTLPSNPLFSHFVGITLTSGSMFVMVNPDSYIF